VYRSLAAVIALWLAVAVPVACEHGLATAYAHARFGHLAAHAAQEATAPHGATAPTHASHTSHQHEDTAGDGAAHAGDRAEASAGTGSLGAMGLLAQPHPAVLVAVPGELPALGGSVPHTLLASAAVTVTPPASASLGPAPPRPQPLPERLSDPPPDRPPVLVAPAA
jgi:hypothetical protein